MFCTRCHTETKDLHAKVPVCAVCTTLILMEWSIRHNEEESLGVQSRSVAQDKTMKMAGNGAMATIPNGAMGPLRATGDGLRPSNLCSSGVNSGVKRGEIEVRVRFNDLVAT